jgi:hypothetical protein
MEQDVEVLIDMFQWLMAQKPAAEARDRARVRRDHTEAGNRGFGFDMDDAITSSSGSLARQQVPGERS